MIKLKNNCCSCNNESYTCVDIFVGFQLCYLLDGDHIIDFQVRFVGNILADLQISPDRLSSYYVNIGPYIFNLDVSIVSSSEKSCLHVKGDIKTLFGETSNKFEFDMIYF